MATSRYDTAAPSASSSAARNASGGYTTETAGNQNTNSQTNSTSTTNANSNSVTNASSTTNTQNMTSTALAALEGLIAQLAGGGTQAMRVADAQRNVELAANRQQRERYSADSAFADAQGLIAQTMRQSLEKVLPGINAAARGAGASQSSMRALLLQRAQENAAEAASAQGLQASVNYGQVANGASQILASLVNGQSDQATQALLSALQTARGAVTNSTTNSTQETNSNSSQTTNSQSNTNSNTNSNQTSTVTPNSGGGGGGSSGKGNGNSLIAIGPSATDSQVASQLTGSSLDTLLQLAGGGNSSSNWGDFTF